MLSPVKLIQNYLTADGKSFVPKGKVNLETMVTHRISLDDIEMGLHLCRDFPDKTIKVVVNILP